MNKGIKEIWILALGIALVFLLARSDFARAEEAAGSGGPTESFSSKIEKLENLRAQNPEAFRKWMTEHRTGFRQRMAELKETDPAKFEEIVTRRRALKEKWLERMKEKNPARYERWMNGRRQRFERKLENFRQNHPQAYERMMHQRMNRLDALKVRNPERYEQFMQKHPQLARRIDHARETRPAPTIRPAAGGERKHPPYSRKRFRGRGDNS